MVWKMICLLNLWAAVAVMTGPMGGPVEAAETSKRVDASGAVSTETDDDAPAQEIQWFKDRMKISEKYVEKHEGVWGMSWAHFFTMVFLVLFAFGSLVVFVQRQRRTREILELIRKEMENGASG